MTTPESPELPDPVLPARLARTDLASKFPASVVAGGRRRGRRRARAVIAVVLVAVVAVGGGLAMRASASGPSSYRTATASQRDIESLLNTVATIEPVSQATVGFPVAGTVATVAVAVGDTVTAGQTLATLDVTALTATLHQKQAALDAANLTLQRALNGESVSATTRSFSTARATPQYILYAASTSDSNPDLAAAQQAVLAAQHDVDTARAQAATSLASATTVCAAIGVDVTTDPAAALTSINACQTALQAVVTAQTAVSDAQTALASASGALDDLLTQLANQLPPPTTEPPTTTTTEPPTTEPPTTEPTTAPSPTTTEPSPTTTVAGPTTSTTEPSPMTTAPPTTSTTVPSPATTPGRGGPPAGDTTATTTPGDSSGTGSATGTRSGGSGGFSRSAASSGGGGGGGSAPAAASPSSADLVSYQSAVDAAAGDVTVAQQALAQATVVSPIAGTVVAVNIAAGDSAAAASTTQNVVVQGPGGYEANTTVSLNDVAKIKVGQAATVTADGATAPVAGKVVAISAVPTSTAATTSYGVVIALPPDAPSLRNGAIGSVGIVTGSASGVAVPTSAVTTTGTRHTVTVVEGSTTQVVAVQVGVVGTTWTQITNGLQAGQQVVLATVSEPLPSSATNVTTNANATVTGNPFAGGRFRGAFGRGQG